VICHSLRDQACTGCFALPSQVSVDAPDATPQWVPIQSTLRSERGGSTAVFAMESSPVTYSISLAAAGPLPEGASLYITRDDKRGAADLVSLQNDGVMKGAFVAGLVGTRAWSRMSLMPCDERGLSLCERKCHMLMRQR
jgi:hypothetical protein